MEGHTSSNSYFTSFETVNVTIKGYPEHILSLPEALSFLNGPTRQNNSLAKNLAFIQIELPGISDNRFTYPKEARQQFIKDHSILLGLVQHCLRLERAESITLHDFLLWNIISFIGNVTLLRLNVTQHSIMSTAFSVAVFVNLMTGMYLLTRIYDSDHKTKNFTTQRATLKSILDDADTRWGDEKTRTTLGTWAPRLN